MAFCPNCGSFMNDDDKFCGNCGTVVAPAQNANAAPQENAQPTYQQNVQPNFQQNVSQNFQQNSSQNFQQNAQPNYQQGYQQNYQQGYQPNAGMAYNQQQYIPQAPSAFGIAMGNLGKDLVSFFKNPVATITKTRFEFSAIGTFFALGIMSVLIILQNFWSAAHIRAHFGAITGINSLEDLFGAAGSELSGLIGLGKVFLTSFMFVILMMAAIWGIMLLINIVILKGSFNVVHALNVLLFAAIPYLALALLGTILGYADLSIGYMIYLAGVMSSFILIYKAVSSNVNKSETAAFYSMMVAVLALYLLNFIIFKIAGPSVSGFYHGVFMGIM
ncbi:MAG: zinc ribbon domain-containing protein [Bacillota bacterium]|nr:zinc ribbon domain-containing protein [Bacillota bacterium]